MIGETVGNYQVIAQLGSGSMGVVFLAEHKWIERQAAIKLLTPDLARNVRAVRRFFNEARATAAIRHPGIVDVYDCDIDRTGRAYMVMERLEGETLEERLRQAGKLHWTEACLIAGKVADALGAAHDKKIIHRDLKPANIFLIADARDRTANAVKVLDFGLAKLMTVDRAVPMTMRGMLVGTPEYMSPEQCGGSDAIDYRTDIYALGCVLFEVLTGLPPLVGSDLREILTAQRFRPAPSLAERGSDAPAWLSELVARMLAKDPAERPSSMHDVSEALRERRGPVLAAVLTMAGRAMAVSAPGGEEPRAVEKPPEERVAPPVGRGRPRNVEIAVALVGVFALIGTIWVSRRNRAPVNAKPAEALVTTETRPAIPPPVTPTPVADSPSLERRLDQPVRPSRPVRPAAHRPRRVVETDGIVDL